MLLAYVALVRLPYLIDGVVAFSFDHGKDSIAIMHMILTYSPKLIGPWTSIPGLFFGPGWYYLLAPFYLIGGFNPIAPVFAMLVLVMIQVVLAKKYLGWYEAIIISSAPTWMSISTSSWNPFPMTLLTLGIIIILSRVKKRLRVSQSAGLGFLSGMGFHFSAAFAIFFFPIIGIIFWSRKTSISLKAISAGLLSVVAAFVPQLIFEIRHGFSQTKAVWSFLSEGGEQSAGVGQFWNILESTLGELKLAIIPELRGYPEFLNSIILVMTLLIIAFGIYRLIKRRIAKDPARKEVFEAIIWLIIPVIGLSLLHYNIWYVLSLAPVVVRLVSHFLRLLPKPYAVAYLILILLTPMTMLQYYYASNRDSLSQSRAMLPAKIKAIDYIRDQAGENPFASYHYAPDIYDFSYQYLYFWQAYHGQSLLSEFSYKPNAPVYIVEKSELLGRFDHNPQEPKLIFYVVEKPHNQDFLDQWWDEQVFGEIVNKESISSEVVVYTANPIIF